MGRTRIEEDIQFVECKSCGVVGTPEDFFCEDCYDKALIEIEDLRNRVEELEELVEGT